MDKKRLKEELKQFIGTVGYTIYSPIFRYVAITDGVKYLAEKASCYWLLDEIAIAQKTPKFLNDPALKEVLSWKLKKSEPEENYSEAFLTCEKDKDIIVFLKKIEFTDFPLNEITIYSQHTIIDDKVYIVLMLPSEY